MLEGELVLVGPEKEKARIKYDDGDRVKVRYLTLHDPQEEWIRQDEFRLITA